MPKKSVMQFHNYSVSELHYKSCEVPEGKNEFEIRPNFTVNTEDIGDNRYNVSLSIGISPEEDNQIPFELRAALIGHFSFSEDVQSEQEKDSRQKLLSQNAVAILFPFLRAMVSTLTASANITPLMIPIMNFFENE